MTPPDGMSPYEWLEDVIARRAAAPNVDEIRAMIDANLDDGKEPAEIYKAMGVQRSQYYRWVKA